MPDRDQMIPVCIRIAFDMLRKFKPFDDRARRQVIVDQLNTIDGVKIPMDSANNGSPMIELAVLADIETRQAVLEVFNAMFRDLREAATIARGI